MKWVVNDVNEINFSINPSVATIGFFDGVHVGHVFLLDILKAKCTGLETTVITFDTHIQKDSLMSLSDKVAILETYGIDNIIIIANNFKNFNASREDFIKFLEKLNIKKIYSGIDFRFGVQATGDVSFLKEFFDVEIVDFKQDQKGKISSSDIRNDLDAGDIISATKKLGRNHFIRGVVVVGDQLGRTINFPTANIESKFYLPSNGVYMTKTQIHDKIYLSLTNIGTRPTVKGVEKRIETHILDFDEDLYGQQIKVEFIDRIRDECQFSGLEELKIQIQKDVERAREYYGN